MTIDDFIVALQRISPEKRKVPLVVHAPNGLEFEPVIKMQFTDGVLPCFDPESKLEKMVITYR